MTIPRAAIATAVLLGIAGCSLPNPDALTYEEPAEAYPVNDGDRGPPSASKDPVLTPEPQDTPPSAFSPPPSSSAPKAPSPPSSSAREAPRTYKLPWSCGKAFRCTAGNYDFHHRPPEGQFAWDFSMSKGTPIRASRGGKVSSVRDATGPGDACYNGCIGMNLDTCCPVCIGKANIVTVDHGDGTFAQYAHLDSVAVTLGALLEQGDIVGAAGTTGCSTGVHLHFEVQTKGGKSVSISFEEASIPDSGKSFTSENACK